ncbi:hypothetical protein J6590_092370, partial [Homalodisca vitripennis]
MNHVKLGDKRLWRRGFTRIKHVFPICPTAREVPSYYENTCTTPDIIRSTVPE